MELDLIKGMFETALTIRRFEEAAIDQYRQGRIYGYLHPYLGEEAIATGVISALRPDDYIVSTHRGHGHAIAKGHDIKLMLAELMGKESGYCHGRGGSMHVANLAQNNLGANGIVGGGIPLATGAGLAVKYKGGDQVVICFFGDGAINQGVFHESINLAAIYKLPVIFVVENNHYAVSTRIQDSTLIPNLSQRADGFGIPGISLDGNDAVVIHEEMVKVVARTRQVQGPTLVECKTYRHGGHHINDPGAYMPEEEMKYWKSKDPVLVLRKRLADEGVAEHELKEIEQRVEAKIEEAVAFAINSPEPSKEAFLAEISVL
ncbi:MAG: thiamine pyrophosphate-dependent dehydrogenase E1 component subunit alpha [Anaerolineae bacterium]|nr:thiamine pyrophosphate-dependent dehydrogenase E1 component subunit alpha [Anaerolineae bacterium]